MTIKVTRIKNLRDSKNRSLAGFTTLSGRNIFIRQGLSKDLLFETLVHEFTHLALIMSKQKVSNKKHEKIAYATGVLASKALKHL